MASSKAKRPQAKKAPQALRAKALGVAKLNGQKYMFWAVPQGHWRLKEGKKFRDIGAVYFRENKVYVCSDLSAREMLSTLIHETIHIALEKDFEDRSAEIIAQSIDDALAKTLLDLDLIKKEKLEKIRKKSEKIREK